jgi:hypothetical protein
MPILVRANLTRLQNQPQLALVGFSIAYNYL